MASETAHRVAPPGERGNQILRMAMERGGGAGGGPTPPRSAATASEQLRAPVNFAPCHVAVPTPLATWGSVRIPVVLGTSVGCWCSAVSP